MQREARLETAVTGVSRNKQLFRRSDIYYQDALLITLSPPIYVFGGIEHKGQMYAWLE